MTPDELKKIISRGETLTVEFKSDREKLSDRALVEALAAMANTDGGVLILGIEDKTGEITGLHRQHQNCGTPTAMVANRTVPSLHVAAELAKRRSLTVAQILELTQRDEKCVREYLKTWSGQGVVRLAAGGKAYALTVDSLTKMGMDGLYLSSDHDRDVRNRILEHLERFGTIKRSILVESSGLSEKQAASILSKMAESGEIMRVGAGRSTSCRLARKIAPSP